MDLYDISIDELEHMLTSQNPEAHGGRLLLPHSRGGCITTHLETGPTCNQQGKLPPESLGEIRINLIHPWFWKKNKCWSHIMVNLKLLMVDISCWGLDAQPMLVYFFHPRLTPFLPLTFSGVQPWMNCIIYNALVCDPLSLWPQMPFPSKYSRRPSDPFPQEIRRSLLTPASNAAGRLVFLYISYF